MTEVVTLISIAVLAILLALFVLLLPIAIVFNFRAGLKYREALAGKIEKLRLGRMLVALGIDIDEYVSTERGVDIYQHMNRCKACTNTEECDDRLGSDNIDSGNIKFCNNEESLQEIIDSRK